MTHSSQTPQGRKLYSKGGKWIPALCNILGTLMILLVVISCLPIVIARMTGYEVYNVVSGSMEPEIPVGSAVYVESVAPKGIVTGDVIAFHSGNSVVVHRVVENRTREGEFVTKGDANAAEDLFAVGYEDLIGRVSKHYPVLGTFLFFYTSTTGKVYAICFAGCGALLNLLAGRLRSGRSALDEQQETKG